ncbi:helix-turn-helix domain-containing protein [Plantactinospora endophytica]|uniref:Transcriptional regulator n=1 Tax=Plantactinospora endophytica TaxID=673535 RepID=A0ABQ4E808_9ACTN|nr:helix-turn-helix transcriptional regulator [Plantactinospora endophytica]GIG90867.1 transcriptional regulator [Plantactinospora endophytica]
MSNNGVPQILKFLRTLNGGMTQEQVAARLNVSTSLIAKFETSRLVPMPDTAKQIDELFGSGDLVQSTAAAARKTTPQEWFRQWPDVEREAVAIRWHEANYVPGLLQTEAYARAVLTSGLFDADEVEEQLTLRMERQAAVFGREKPPVGTFVVDELALMRGEPRPMLKEQLAHLVEMSTRQLVFIHVVPRSAGLYAGQMGPLILASLPGGGDVAFLEDQAAGRLLAEPDQVAAMARAWDAIRSVALPRDMSRDLIVRMANEQ